MKTYTQDEIKNILKTRVNGEKLRLSYSDLSYSDLSYSNLSNSNLSNSDLSDSNLSYSNLSNSNLRNSDLRYSDLRNSNLSNSNLSNSNFRNSDLRYSDLHNSNLSNSNLWNTIGNNREIKTLICFSEYHINYTADTLQIGCENHAIKDWREFDDDRILMMGGKRALTFWRKNKDILRMIIEQNPATPTGFEQA
jgi:hypothetical protein